MTAWRDETHDGCIPRSAVNDLYVKYVAALPEVSEGQSSRKATGLIGAISALGVLLGKPETEVTAQVEMAFDVNDVTT
jgi:hypothetical protein